MKIFDVDWDVMRLMAKHWATLPPAAKQAFLTVVESPQLMRPEFLGKNLRELMDCHFLIYGTDGVRVRVAPDLHGPWRAFRAMDRIRVHDAQPGGDMLSTYLYEHFTQTDLSQYFGSSRIQPYASPKWIEDFLSVTREEWAINMPGRREDESAHFPSLEIFEEARSLVREAIRRDGPIPIAELDDFSGVTIRLLIRNFILFPALRDLRREAVIGLWPPILKRLNRKTAVEPRVATAAESVHLLALTADIRAALIACAAEPMRLRVNDLTLFTKAEQTLAAALAILPQWAADLLGISSRTRINLALQFARSFGMLKLDDRGYPSLALTPEGKSWTASGERAQLKSILDRLRGERNAAKGKEDFDGDDTEGEYNYSRYVERPEFLPYEFRHTYDAELAGRTVTAVREFFLNFSPEKWFSFDEMVAYRESSNPFLKTYRDGEYFPLYGPQGMTYARTADDLERSWNGLLFDFLRVRLFPLGGARVGRDAGGRLLIQLTEIGLYLLGARKDFQMEQAPQGQVVVQPNFDVVFLGPAPALEADISRFAERRGREAGTLFRITKKSVLNAAAAGSTSESALETLRAACSKPLPGNVEREIKGWFNSCRRVSMRQAILIDCPDAETALRIRGIDKSIEPVSPTVLSFTDHRLKSAIVRKLRDMGIFV